MAIRTYVVCDGCGKEGEYEVKKKDLAIISRLKTTGIKGEISINRHHAGRKQDLCKPCFAKALRQGLEELEKEISAEKQDHK